MTHFGPTGKCVEIEKDIEEFLAEVSEAGTLFTQGVKAYLNTYMASFKSFLLQTVETERSADELRRTIEEKLYGQTLIPESRGDVLRLIENMDSLLGQYKGTLWQLRIEQPEIDEIFWEDFNTLVKFVVASVEAVTQSIRAFFQNREEVKEQMQKVSYWETEADKASTRLQMAIFRREGMHLSHRMQLRDFVRQVDHIADQAEDVADSLAIYVIKRAL
ncbi:DUF47 family protein [Desulfoluna sp.]|uniref:DUF47 domain-containing protein n=1 Tax=Desulfoluna sp. TaxID=2045199 RepID=UPI00260504CD|nr:DUF47 family protein [Desulfoluna sp.]